MIGIIAILIGILLPALSGARRSAQQVKCGAALQQIGLGFQLYANDQKGYFPVAKMNPASLVPPPVGGTYSIGDQLFNSANPAYWYNFIADYVAAAGIGTSLNNGSNVNLAKRSIIWGCPAFEGYVSTTTNTVTAGQTGYGMNGFPNYTDSYPTANTWPWPSGDNNYAIIPSGRFFKQNEWTNPAARALVGDSRFWFMEAQDPPASGPYPPAVAPQYSGGSKLTWTGGSGTATVHQTQVDIYRHGRNPSPLGNDTFDPGGGKISYNLLFSDFHVGQFSEGQTAYSALRMRFPG